MRLAFLVLLSIFSATGWTAQWQWSVAVKSMVSSENQDHPRAFLWIPSQCKQVRGVVVGQHNMEEEPILEHPLFRKALSELNFAAIWITPGLDLAFNTGKGAGDHFNTMMIALAKESGYTELEFVPIVPIGHSAAASYPWNFAAWNPKRTLAAISISGQWPFWQSPDQPDWSKCSIDGIPGIVTMGEYEAANERAGEGLKQRREHPKVPLSMLAEPGAGHFDVSDEKVAYLALYLKKAAQYRLPDEMPLDRPVQLKPIDPTKQGWLVNRWQYSQASATPAAAVGKYIGDAKEAFWFFDEKLAVATEQFEARYRDKNVDLLGYVQDGKVVEQNKKTHQQVTLKFLPIDDGLTFKLTGTFIDTVPEGRPESWTGKKAGSPVQHAQGGGPVTIHRICGPVQKLSDDTFAIRFDRIGTINKKRSNEVWLLATHPGDDQYRRVVQQSVLHFPLRNNEGADQHITFAKIADQPTTVQSIPLKATSDSKARVYFYVLAGPAEIEKDTLKFTAIPPRSKFPVKVTVVAWQWGRTIEPKLKTADPVEQTFYIIN